MIGCFAPADRTASTRADSPIVVNVPPSSAWRSPVRGAAQPPLRQQFQVKSKTSVPFVSYREYGSLKTSKITERSFLNVRATELQKSSERSSGIARCPSETT